MISKVDCHTFTKKLYRPFFPNLVPINPTLKNCALFDLGLPNMYWEQGSAPLSGSK